MINPDEISSSQLRIFLAVVSEGSISKAAQKLFLTQPAVSQALIALEKQLDVKLFHRSRKGLAPTQAAEFLHKGAVESERALLQALSSIAELGEMKRGSLSVAASDTISLYLLPEPLSKFRKAYPEVELNVRNRSSDEIVEMVKRRDADVGLISLDHDEKDLWVKKIGKSSMILITPENTFEKNRKVTLRDIAQLDLILLEKGSRIRRSIESAFASLRETPKIAMEVSSFEVAKRFVSMGLGSSLVPEIALEKTNQKINSHDAPSKFSPVVYGLVTLPGIGDPAIEKFMELFKSSKLGS